MIAYMRQIVITGHLLVNILITKAFSAITAKFTERTKRYWVIYIFFKFRSYRKQIRKRLPLPISVYFLLYELNLMKNARHAYIASGHSCPWCIHGKIIHGFLPREQPKDNMFSLCIKWGNWGKRKVTMVVSEFYSARFGVISYRNTTEFCITMELTCSWYIFHLWNKNMQLLIC